MIQTPSNGGLRHHRFAAYRLNVRVVPGLAMLCDGLLLLCAFLISRQIYPVIFDQYYNTVFIILLILVVVLFRYAKLYAPSNITSLNIPIEDIFLVYAISASFIFSIINALDVYYYYRIEFLFSFFAIGAIVSSIGRYVAANIWRRLSHLGVIENRLAVLGDGEQARRFLSRVNESDPFFLSISGVFSLEPQDAASTKTDIEGHARRGGLDELLARVRADEVDSVIIAMPWSDDSAARDAVELLKEMPIDVFLSTDLIGFELAFRPTAGEYGRLPMFEVVQRPLAGWRALVKMVVDYVLGTLLLVALSPLLALIALAVRLDTPGPVLFRQERLGFNNKPFAIYKFRSMHHRDQPEAKVRQATKDDPRVTRVGRIIRATSLDELPQLLNVLDGTMSLVGPRPHALSHNEEYGRQIRGYFARHNVKPGITGWAQVNGFRGETDDIAKMEERIRHDVHYAENWSLLLDLRILAMTALVVAFQRNAY